MSDVPGRLADLADLLRSRYSTAIDEPERRELVAIHRGEPRVDLEYAVMPGAVERVRQWQAVLPEMDAYCRDEQLLTLATPPDVAGLQTWVLQEFVRQLDGSEPGPGPAGPTDSGSGSPAATPVTSRRARWAGRSAGADRPSRDARSGQRRPRSRASSPMIARTTMMINMMVRTRSSRVSADAAHAPALTAATPG